MKIRTPRKRDKSNCCLRIFIELHGLIFAVSWREAFKDLVGF